MSKNQTVNQILKQIVLNGIQSANFSDSLKSSSSFDVQIEKTKSQKNGDYATSISLKLSKVLNKNPAEIESKEHSITIRTPHLSARFPMKGAESPDRTAKVIDRLS